MRKMKQIPGFPNYSVTKDGRVWSKKRPRAKEGWLSFWIDRDGYLNTVLYQNGSRRIKRIHHLVLETYVGSRPINAIARHLNGNPQDNRPGNLRWGTSKQNTWDSIRHRTAACLNQNGSKNPASKLNEDQVRLIFHTYHDGAYTQRELANYFGIARSLVGLICQKKRWGHLWVT